MYFVDNNSGVTDMPPLAPSQGTQVKWFTEGDGRKGISHIGQDWLNIVQAELLAILTEGKVQPDKAKLNQLVTAIKAIIAANAYSRKNNLKEIADAGAEAQAAARRHLGLGGLSGKDSLAAADVGALEKSRNFDDVPDKPTARLNLDVYSKGEGDERYLRRDQNGADIPDKGTFIDNVGLRDTVNRAANALPSNGTAVAASRLANARRINGVAFDGTQDINITSGMTQGDADARYVQNVMLGASARTETTAPAGCVVTFVDGGSKMEFIMYKPVQIYIGGAWRTISG
ncbi:phage tail protein [Escherichia coli]|nr:phage tail protein [Escherichia coli]MCA2074235.1 phage tail protein [Escherichia coli]MCA2140173.1 phage tail protein [Escherichia coli]